ncbi:hypothetical protein KFE25_008003 [Diacronema lutheri]|uniref:Serine aminopeptidase S33 domain-containing protein n=1 Tax=Diacronema lutheri TaxID=2081491 RepID=A0A8J5XU68_DIALT|nr:hypothetical protein KFE25_008003 [Diacronema lutheri]
MGNFFDRASERLLTTCARRTSYQSAEGRRAAFPPDESYPTPTRCLKVREAFPPFAESTAFFALPDGQHLWWRQVRPKDAAPRAVMVFFHGYGDHSSFHMLQVAREYVAELHVAALIVDMPNHGRSDGLYVLLRSWTALIVAMERWCDGVCEPARITAVGAKLPLFAYGASMGGAVLIDIAMRSPDRFDGVVLCAPMVRVAQEARPHPGVEAFLRHVICRIPLVRDLALVPNDGFFENIFGVDARWRMDEHRANALNYTGPTRFKTGLTLIDAADCIASRMETLRTPFIVLHGGADLTTAPALSRELHARAGAADKALLIVDGARHALDFGETAEVHERVFAATFDWLRTRIARAAIRDGPASV